MWDNISYVGSFSRALSHDYKSFSIWSQQFQCLAVARHNGSGIIDGLKVWKLNTRDTLSNHFQSSYRQVVTTGGPVQEIKYSNINYDTDPILASSGSNNNLAFNWRYSNNGARIVLTDVGHHSGTLSGENVNDDDSHGIGNDLACDHSNQVASDKWWFDVGKLQGDCHGTSCTILGTDQGGGYLQKTKYGNYAFLIGDLDSTGKCPIATTEILLGA
ncbi:hypothetical protein CTEN210_04059 [Chaetoceros tenuissimus]|uniref:Uncharacterized protein n=1 Tax=Chaetoceros tenuissimus TaxID=426638 RepID=A0AAD3H2K9_9STRA|nr:hypothetical protein CTEN210_04059 [Chaetoceros tenuissimus]